MTAHPTVSVIMSVYNGERYLSRAVESVLRQTVGDIELLLLDDASTDNTPTLLADYARGDARVVLLRNETNLGLTRSLNRGLAAARGEFIARMDADDIAHPQRFARQLAFFAAHQEVGLLGTAYTTIDARGRWRRAVRVPTSDAEIRWRLLSGNAFGHSTVMFRRALLAVHGLAYDPDQLYVEDYDLWVRLLAHTRGANLPALLLIYREHGGNVSLRKQDEQARHARAIATRQLIALSPALAEDAEALQGVQALVAGLLDEDDPAAAPYRPAFDAVLAAFCQQQGLTPVQVARLHRYRAVRRLEVLRQDVGWWSAPALRRLARRHPGTVLAFSGRAILDKLRVSCTACLDHHHPPP